jgi:hypothetical protein
MNNENLSEKIEALFDSMDSDHALLTPNLFLDKETMQILHEYECDPYTGYAPGQLSYGSTKKVTIEGSEFNILYVPTRSYRNNADLLFELGIKKRGARQYYEYDDPSIDQSYITYIDEASKKNLPKDVQDKIKKATIYNYPEQNPKGKLIDIDLYSKNGLPRIFCITANWAPFEKYHYIIFAKNNENLALKQIYHNNKTLYWIDDLFTQLNSPAYSLFFNPQGAGYSMDTLHFQLIKNSFPVFEALEQKYPLKNSKLIHTNNSDWPFKGILARYTSNTKNEVLSVLNGEINHWISGQNNTFNLLFRMRQDGYREYFFVFRNKGLIQIKEISNDIAGYEVAGNIIVEDRKDYENFPDKIEKLEWRDTV